MYCVHAQLREGRSEQQLLPETCSKAKGLLPECSSRHTQPCKLPDSELLADFKVNSSIHVYKLKSISEKMIHCYGGGIMSHMYILPYHS